MILVVGDVMLDTYIEGVVTRISPEAPVPVLQVCNETHYLGGAANVARNLRMLNVPLELVSVVGKDDTADMIRTELDGSGIAHRLIVDEKRWTTRKTRYEAHGQQILRVDDEAITDIDGLEMAEVTDHVKYSINDADLVVLSDYGKGVLTHDVCQKIIETASEVGVRVLVDPKCRNFSRYRGATVIKPNAAELAAATGMPTETKEECIAAAVMVRDTFNIANVLVTRGHGGMILVTHSKAYVEPGHIREVTNIVGAGDTALAAVALGMSKDWMPDKIIEFANMAAAIVVSKHGTATVTVQEVLDAFKRA